MIVDLSKITKKFYKDSEIWEKARATEPLLNEFMGQMGNFLAELHIKGYRFFVFHMDDETLHAALLYCCGRMKGQAVDVRLRKEVIEPQITLRTRYKRIIWEDLIQLGVRF